MPSPKVQRIIALHERTSKFPYLIKVTHPNLGYVPYANSKEDIVYNNVIYNAASFSIQPPDQDGSKIGNATLTISAIDQVWIERIRETQIPASLQFIAVIVYDGQGGFTGIEPLEENSFTLRAARWNETSITWDLSFDERMGYIITSAKCTPQNVPGCA